MVYLAGNRPEHAHPLPRIRQGHLDRISGCGGLELDSRTGTST